MGVAEYFSVFRYPGLPGASPKPPEKTKELMELRQRLCDQNCAVCHGLKGDANTSIAKSLNPPPSDFAGL